MSSKHLCNFLSTLNLGIRTKKPFIRLILRTSYLKKLLVLLSEKGLILGYRKIFALSKKKNDFESKNIESFIVYFKPNLLNELKIISSPGKKKWVGVSYLNSFHQSHRGLFYLVSSEKLGFATSLDCVETNTGGLLLCTIRLNG